MTSNQRDFKTEIYHRGVVMTLSWKNEDQYLQGKALLDQLTKGPYGYLYYLEDAEYEALMDFRQRLRRGN